MIILTALSLAIEPVPMRLSRADINAAHRAGGFVWRGGRWRSDCPDLGNPSYVPGRITRVADFNRDGHPDVVITEHSAACFGNTGTRFTLMSKAPGGRWRRMARLPGYPRFLVTRGVQDWPDIELGVPGMCTPVYRWYGREYRLYRFSRADAPHCRLPNDR